MGSEERCNDRRGETGLADIFAAACGVINLDLGELASDVSILMLGGVPRG